MLKTFSFFYKLRAVIITGAVQSRTKGKLLIPRTFLIGWLEEKCDVFVAFNLVLGADGARAVVYERGQPL